MCTTHAKVSSEAVCKRTKRRRSAELQHSRAIVGGGAKGAQVQHAAEVSAMQKDSRQALLREVGVSAKGDLTSSTALSLKENCTRKMKQTKIVVIFPLIPTVKFPCLYSVGKLVKIKTENRPFHFGTNPRPFDVIGARPRSASEENCRRCYNSSCSHWFVDQFFFLVRLSK